MRVGFLGTGVMGQPMVERLLAAGHRVVAYNRTREKAERLRPAGAEVADRPEEAISAGEVVILMLADAAAIREVLLSPAARTRLAGRTVIQMGTIGPQESQALEQDITARGGEYLEAPVLGSKAEAEAGRLIVMVGASPEQFGRWTDLLSCFGPKPRLVGPVGQAAALKLALNQLIASQFATFALSTGFVLREQIPVDLFMEVLRESALYAPAFDKKLPRILKRDFAHPNFSARHMLKDVGLFLEEADRLGLQSDALHGVRRLLEKTLQQGWSDQDYSVLFKTVLSEG